MNTEEPNSCEIKKETPSRWGISVQWPVDLGFDLDQWKTHTFPKLCLENGFIEADWSFTKIYCPKFVNQEGKPLDIKEDVIMISTRVDPNI